MKFPSRRCRPRQPCPCCRRRARRPPRRRPWPWRKRTACDEDKISFAVPDLRGDASMFLRAGSHNRAFRLYVNARKLKKSSQLCALAHLELATPGRWSGDDLERRKRRALKPRAQTAPAPHRAAAGIGKAPARHEGGLLGIEGAVRQQESQRREEQAETFLRGPQLDHTHAIRRERVDGPAENLAMRGSALNRPGRSRSLVRSSR